MKIRFFSLAILFSILWASTAFADEYVKEQEDYFQRFFFEKIKSACKNEIKLSINVKSFEKYFKKNDKRKSSLYQTCGRPLDKIADYCQAGFSESVGKKIKSYTCQFASGKPKISLKKGTLSYDLALAHPDPGKYAQKEIGKIMKHGDFNVAQAMLIRNDQGRLKSYMTDFPRSCKNYKLDWKVDWKSFKKALDARVGSNNLRSIWQGCYEPMRAIGNRCLKGQRDLAKDQIKSYVCRYGDELAMSLEKGKLTYSADLKTEGYGTWVENNLGDLIRDGDFSVRQTDFIKEEDAHFKRLKINDVNNACDTKIESKIDWKSLEGEMDKRINKEDKSSIYDSCGVPLDRLADMCRNNGAKSKVKKKIKNFVCEVGGKKPKFSLKKGKLTYKVSFTAKDVYGAVDKFLVKKKIIKKKPKPKKLSPKELSKIRSILFAPVGSKQQCKRNCSKTCRNASNKSKCKSRCRSACR